MNKFAGSMVALLCAGSALSQQGTYTFTGVDCPFAHIDAIGVPTIGQAFVIDVAPNLAPIDGPFSYLLTGFRPLTGPVDIGVVTGHQPCGPIAAFCGLLYSSVEVAQLVPFAIGPIGTAQVVLPIPNDVGLVGLTFFQQNMTVGAGFGPACVSLSRGARGVIGA